MHRLIAFHGQQAVKDKYVSRVIAHRAAERLVRGTGWEDGKGCAIGCTLEKYEHAAYETELGIPRSLARIEDGIFEGLPLDEAMEWPERFLSAIPVGADLSLVTYRFIHWMLIDPSEGVIKYAQIAQSRSAIQRVANLYERNIAGENVELADWRSAQSEAAAVYAAVYAAAVYAAAAARTAARTAYADAAYADAAARTAAHAAYADAAAARTAARTAYADAAAYAAAYAADDDDDAPARAQARSRQAAKLIELLQSAPVMQEVV